MAPNDLPARPLPEVRPDEEPLFGGKAVNLASALRAGLPVPNGVALPFPFAEAIATGRDGALASVRKMLAKAIELGRGVAVRSSAIGEDGASASFAGQHLTVLALDSVDAVIDAVRKVHASASTPSSLAYRERM